MPQPLSPAVNGNVPPVPSLESKEPHENGTIVKKLSSSKSLLSFSFMDFNRWGPTCYREPTCPLLSLGQGHTPSLPY
jgi:hypothetical protein